MFTVDKACLFMVAGKMDEALLCVVFGSRDTRGMRFSRGTMIFMPYDCFRKSRLFSRLAIIFGHCGVLLSVAN